MYTKVIIILISFFLFFFKDPLCAHAEDTNRFCFAVMVGISNPHDYVLAVEKIKEYDPAFVLFLGGMVEANKEKPVESLWEEFDQITEKLGVPVYDVPSETSRSSDFQPRHVSTNRAALMEKCFLERFKKRYYSFEHKDNLFICLNSEKRDDLFNGDQLDFLKKTIADVSKYDNVFVALNRFSLPMKINGFKPFTPLSKERLNMCLILVISPLTSEDLMMLLI